MTPVPRPWPPLIVAAHPPFWTRLRDVATTCLAWLALVLLLNREVELGLASYLRGWGWGDLAARLGLADIDGSQGWLETYVRVHPYLTILSLLLVFLSAFGLHTILRRQRALKAPPPRSLSLHQEARDAALLLPGRDSLDSVGMAPDEIVSGPSLLALLNAQDRAALVHVRRMRIVNVKVDSTGRYRIVDATGPVSERLEHQAEALVIEQQPKDLVGDMQSEETLSNRS